jgi:hypothetical protein
LTIPKIRSQVKLRKQSAITGVAEATGVASTGKAKSTLHGIAATKATLASIGGGGIAAGQAILHGLDITTTAVGSNDGVSTQSSEDVKN